MPASPHHRPFGATLVSGTPAVRAWRVITVLLLVAVLGLALSPTVPNALTTGWDKANHALAFCALGFSGRLGLPGGLGRWLLLGFALFVLGAGIEVVQQFVPGRSADVGDLVADAVGAAVGMALAATAGRLLGKSPRPAVSRA